LDRIDMGHDSQRQYQQQQQGLEEIQFYGYHNDQDSCLEQRITGQLQPVDGGRSLDWSITSAALQPGTWRYGDSIIELDWLAAE
jgi:hypothetical protein